MTNPLPCKNKYSYQISYFWCFYIHQFFFFFKSRKYKWYCYRKNVDGNKISSHQIFFTYKWHVNYTGQRAIKKVKSPSQNREKNEEKSFSYSISNRCTCSNLSCHETVKCMAIYSDLYSMTRNNKIEHNTILYQ